MYEEELSNLLILYVENIKHSVLTKCYLKLI